MLQKMTKAFDRLQSDGLVADIATISNPEEVIVPTNESDLTKTIRDIDRIMQLCAMPCIEVTFTLDQT